MIYFLKFKEAREQIDKKYREMGYNRAYELIKFFTKSEIISFPDRTNLSNYLNIIFEIDREKKRKKRQANKLKRANKKNDLVTKNNQKKGKLKD